ncbi:MAG: hypothetical protein KatS3mg046_175 [Bellilinea sp.]|nr:MAG: hypothetical protein KatS3mg046_175 [Bellilinea sp.]
MSETKKRTYSSTVSVATPLRLESAEFQSREERHAPNGSASLPGRLCWMEIGKICSTA